MSMIDTLKKEAMKRGMKLMMNPRVMKMMADPRFMNAITKGFAMKGAIQSEVDAKLRDVACVFNLATKEEVTNLKNTIRNMESQISTLEKKVTGA